MTNEEVMQLMTDMGLHEGGIENWLMDNAWYLVVNKAVEKEREACAKLIAKLTEMLEIQQKLHETAVDMLKPAIEIAVQKEREAIAHMVEPWLLPEYVEKIRTRGNT